MFWCVIKRACRSFSIVSLMVKLNFMPWEMSSKLESTEMISLSPGVTFVNTIEVTEEEKTLNQKIDRSFGSEMVFKSKERKNLKAQKRFVNLFCRCIIVWFTSIHSNPKHIYNTFDTLGLTQKDSEILVFDTRTILKASHTLNRQMNRMVVQNIIQSSHIQNKTLISHSIHQMNQMWKKKNSLVVVPCSNTISTP